jgi:hypothetical protein
MIVDNWYKLSSINYLSIIFSCLYWYYIFPINESLTETCIDLKFNVTANEMWCLALFLPFLIGKFIEEDDNHWKAFCTLLQIVHIVFSLLISKQQMPYLQILIQSHHENLKTLYSHASIIPKMPITILR